MTIEMRNALARVEKGLEDFDASGLAGSIELLIVHGKPLKVRIIQDESLQECKIIAKGSCNKN